MADSIARLTDDSICKEYWQIVLAQGVLVGIGFGCMFVPPLAILPQYFAKRLQFANGIAAVGSGFGEYTTGRTFLDP